MTTAEAAPETRLFRKEHSAWGVPPEKIRHAEYILAFVRREFQMGHAVRQVKWFRRAQADARDGDPETFRQKASVGGYVSRAEPDTIWLNRELCDLSDADLTRVLIHEVCHVDQLARNSPLPVADLERMAEDLTALLTQGLR